MEQFHLLKSNQILSGGILIAYGLNCWYRASLLAVRHRVCDCCYEGRVWRVWIRRLWNGSKSWLYCWPSRHLHSEYSQNTHPSTLLFYCSDESFNLFRPCLSMFLASRRKSVAGGYCKALNFFTLLNSFALMYIPNSCDYRQKLALPVMVRVACKDCQICNRKVETSHPWTHPWTPLSINGVEEDTCQRILW